MIFDLDYPEDFNEEQCQALEAAAEIAGTDDMSELEDYIDCIRQGRYELLPDVQTYEDLGYANREYTGLFDEYAYLFNWEKFGEEINADKRGEFTSYGWITFD